MSKLVNFSGFSSKGYEYLEKAYNDFQPIEDIDELTRQLFELKAIDVKKFDNSHLLKKDIENRFKSLSKFHLNKDTEEMVKDCLVSSADQSDRVHRYITKNFSKLKGDKEVLSHIKHALDQIIPSISKL